MFKSIRYMLLWLSLAATAAHASPHTTTALLAQVPPLQQGLSWTVSLRQMDISGESNTLSTPKLLTYRVVASALVDGRPSWKIEVTSDAKNQSLFVGYLAKSDRQVLRVEYNGRMVNFAPADQTKKQANTAVLSEIGYIPFDMPSFSQHADSATHRFVPILTDWGFPVAVTQQQFEADDHIKVSLKTASKHIKQRWHKNSPWWHFSEQVGVYQATMISPPKVEKHTSAALSATAHIATIDRKIKPSQNWSYPRSVNLAVNQATVATEGPLAATADKQLWSGSWWATSAYHGTVNNLTRTWADGGLLEKYDDFARNNGGRSGAKNWETNHANSFFMEAWHGHCNGWSAASVIFDEPVHAKTVDGIYFSVADQKGLLSELAYGVGIDYYLGPTYRKSSDNPLEPAPYDVHRAIVENMGIHKRAMIADLDNNRQLWNYPFYRYQMDQSPAGDNRVRIALKLWYARATPNDPNYIGLTDSTITYRYYLSTDDNGNVTDGPNEWIANSNPNKTNPDYLWIPSSDAPSGRRRSHNPYLDAAMIEQIIAAPMSTAIDITDSPTSGDLAEAGQAHWYHFDVTVAQKYTIETELVSLKDSRLYLYDDPRGDVLAENDDISSGNRASRISQTLSPGRYYLKVRAYSSSQTGEYRLKVIVVE